MRRQRWLQAQQKQQENRTTGTWGESSSSNGRQEAASSSSGAPAAVSASAPAGPPPSAGRAVAGGPSEASGSTEDALIRLQILPIARPGAGEPPDPFEALKPQLASARQQGMVLEMGMVFEAQGWRFTIAQCVPKTGVIASGTQVFTDGPPLPRVKAVQFTALKRKQRGESDNTLFQQYIAPHFKAIQADPKRCAIINIGDTPNIDNVFFHVPAMDPEGPGVIDEKTQMYTNFDDADEFDRIHVVPFADTLPSAYNFDLFNDYLKPYFRSHLVERLEEGSNFWYNGVQLKVVAVEPKGAPRRVGASTTIYCEGRLHPNASQLLTPDQLRQIAFLPPGLQMLLLQTDMFGNGDIAERIMEAQGMRQRAQAGVGGSTLATVTTEEPWTQALKERLDQDQCMVCLCDFEDDEQVRHLPCKHVFHTGCIDEWLGRDAHCPLCRHAFARGR
mmetsp:Transcript_26553/g.68551  ORF Transcript_26553/g.68551 Transcript_26553/m.68551 type:complete len:446 (-) Transcript_26553:228-1565(-)